MGGERSIFSKIGDVLRGAENVPADVVTTAIQAASIPFSLGDKSVEHISPPTARDLAAGKRFHTD